MYKHETQDIGLVQGIEMGTKQPCTPTCHANNRDMKTARMAPSAKDPHMHGGITNRSKT